MEILVQGLFEARRRGKRYIYRIGAAFVSSRLGLEQIPPLTARTLELDVSPSSPGGLILAGSYVPKTTAHLESLIEGLGNKLATIVLRVDNLLEGPRAAEATILQASDETCRLIIDGKDVLIMTSRKLITGSDKRTSLDIGSVVASSLVLFLRMLNPRPHYVIAKIDAGPIITLHLCGITSSDAATKGLRMLRAKVVGQAASGVPLWRCDEPTSKFTAALAYIVFPGNVGENETLRDLVTSWAA
ncbi:uncharacterized protein A1O9_07520, partial [Exophiala aquamarina CBS 119918]